MRVRKIHLSLCEPKALSSHTKTFSSSQNKDSKIAYLLFFLAFFKLSFACWFFFVCLFYTPAACSLSKVWSWLKLICITLALNSSLRFSFES